MKVTNVSKRSNTFRSDILYVCLRQKFMCASAKPQLPTYTRPQYCEFTFVFLCQRLKLNFAAKTFLICAGTHFNFESVIKISLCIAKRKDFK